MTATIATNDIDQTADKADGNEYLDINSVMLLLSAIDNTSFHTKGAKIAERLTGSDNYLTLYTHGVLGKFLNDGHDCLSSIRTLIISGELFDALSDLIRYTIVRGDYRSDMCSETTAMAFRALSSETTVIRVGIHGTPTRTTVGELMQDIRNNLCD